MRLGDTSWGSSKRGLLLYLKGQGEMWETFRNLSVGLKALEERKEQSGSEIG